MSTSASPIPRSWPQAACIGIAFLLPATVTPAGQSDGTFALLPAPERAGVPDWAQPGRVRYARCDGGPVEVCKAFMSGWECIRRPDAILPCATFYSDSTIDMLRQAHINWIWVTWSVGFSHESEAVQRAILKPFMVELLDVREN